MDRGSGQGAGWFAGGVVLAMAAWGWTIGGGLDPFNQTYWVTMSVAAVALAAAVLKRRRDRGPAGGHAVAKERRQLHEETDRIR